MRYLLIPFFALLLFASSLTAQKLDHRLGYLILQFQPDVNPDAVLADYSTQYKSEIHLDRTLSRRLGIYLIRFDHDRIHEGKLLDQLRADVRTSIAQYDHLTTLRSIPDDPQFPSQWQWLNTGQTGGTANADIDSDLAWDISTGGVTALGDTIVVAIVDDGLDYNHQDIAANVWINYDEIDGNGVDDDDNGYIDDVYGWNAYEENADVWGQSHGLNVAGMIGAVGNNSVGIAGINWNVKLMTIVGGSPESAAIASYAYALDQRILYNETNGEKGAFVVSTNSSWGIDFGQPADAPLWCAFYDVLGENGILSAAATANLSIDIDIENDLPTGCPSEYLLSVTALNDNNERTFSAWGLTTIDFGAPGEDIFTTRRNNQYGTTSGTSFASPVAAGLVALLYSAPCPNLAQLSRNAPAAAASYIRDLIFQGVKPIPGLESILRFGGSLNAGNSMALLMAQCASCPIPLDVHADPVTDTEATITWALIDTADAINARYKPVDATEWDTLLNVSSPLLLSNLLGCTTYEIEFESICADTSSGFESHYEFKTDGCCELPTEINASVSGQTIHLDWSFVLAAEYYVIQWRPSDSIGWQEDIAFTTSYELTGLDPCRFYRVRLSTSCDSTETGFSDIYELRTKGCGNCIDLEYCKSGSDDATQEHIDSLIIGPLVNHSGNNGGYAFFEDIAPAYVAGDSYAIWLRPGFEGFGKDDEQFRIWIDFNQNGVFDTVEMVLDSILSEDSIFLAASISIPDSALAGNTRMRVSMAFTSPFFQTNQAPCDILNFGEVEDYCIEILHRPDECPKVDTVFFDGVSFTGAFMYWPSVEDAIAYTYRYREVGTDEYTELATVDTTANITGLEKCKFYEVQIRTICPVDTTSYNFNFILETDCDVAVEDPAALVTDAIVFPNPASDVAMLRFVPTETGEHHISIFNTQGKRMWQESHFADANQSTLVRLDAIDPYPPGLYVIVIEKGGRSTTEKLIKL